MVWLLLQSALRSPSTVVPPAWSAGTGYALLLHCGLILIHLLARRKRIVRLIQEGVGFACTHWRNAGYRSQPSRQAPCACHSDHSNLDDFGKLFSGAVMYVTTASQCHPPGQAWHSADQHNPAPFGAACSPPGDTGCKTGPPAHSHHVQRSFLKRTVALAVVHIRPGTVQGPNIRDRCSCRNSTCRTVSCTSQTPGR